MDRLQTAFDRFDLVYVPIALLLALVNYLVRFARWHLYLKVLRIPLTVFDSLIVFLAGLILSVTPGKAGEFLKAYCIKSKMGTPVSKSAPAVLAERLTDYIALILLAFIGIFSFQDGVIPLGIGLVVMATIVLILGSPRAIEFARYGLQ